MNPLQNIRDLIVFLLGITKGVTESLAGDGEITWKDTPNFIDAGKALPEAIKDINKVPEEWRNAKPEDIESLKVWAFEQFDLPNDKVEAFVESCISWAVNTTVLIETGIELFKKKPE